MAAFLTRSDWKNGEQSNCRKLAQMPNCGKIMPNTSNRLFGPRVTVLAYDGLCTFEFGVAWEIFGLPRPEMGQNWYRCAIYAVDDGPLRAGGGLTIHAGKPRGAFEKADLIVVPGWKGIEAPVPAHLIRALRRAHARGARLMSLCSGIAVLAATGLLDHRRATTHWRYIDAMRRSYPHITLKPDVLYVDEGDMLTAAGSAAGIDLCLHVVRKDFGADAANTVARRLVVQPHRDGGQAQFISRPVPLEREATKLGPTLDWIRENLTEPFGIRQLAKRAGMSVRTFQRRFEEATGLTPGEWLIAERIRRAQELLEKDLNSSLSDIAGACGFGSLETLRHHFRGRIGISPSAYRSRFGDAPN
jgi:AraC family transcriptional activator FtrA